MAPRVRRVVQHFSLTLHPSMSPEGKSFHTDVQCRDNAPSPQKHVEGQRPRQTIQPTTPVVARGGPNGFTRPLNDERPLRHLGGGGRSPTPPLHESVHAGKAQQAKPDIQSNEDQERLSRKQRSRVTTHKAPLMRRPHASGHNPRHSTALAVDAHTQATIGHIHDSPEGDDARRHIRLLRPTTRMRLGHSYSSLHIAGWRLPYISIEGIDSHLDLDNALSSVNRDADMGQAPARAR